jgi:hypothetical protein
MASPMSFLFLGSVKLVLDSWWFYHGDIISCNHMVSQMEHKDMLHTYNIQAQNSNLL